MVGPLFRVGATSVPGITTLGSSFLTSPIAGGIATGAANALGQKLQSKSVNFRGKFARKQATHNRAQMGPDMRSRVNAVKSAGLHPLAALGITPGAGSQQQAIPGQSPDYGSAVSEGLRTAQNLAGGQQQQAHSKTIAGLQVEEQQLRNDWLRTQIASSEQKRLQQASNYNRPTLRPPMALRPHPTEAERRTYVSPDGTEYSVQGGTPADTLEQDIGEWADWMPQTLGRAFDAMSGQMSNKFGPGTERLKKHLSNRRKIYKKQFLNPTPYKGMGKIHY